MGCNCNKDTYNKVDLNLSCGGKNFAVENYFSELVHDWEKEAARYNLGIQELESIKYYTTTDSSGEKLNKVAFTYRKGHEYKVMEFDVAPQGPEGPEGPSGNDGLSAYDIAKVLGFEGTLAQWIESLKGETPNFSEITVDYTTERQGYGEVEYLTGNDYKLKLHLVKPEIEVASIAEGVINSLMANYYNKSEIDNKFSEIKRELTAVQGLIDLFNDLNLAYDD